MEVSVLLAVRNGDAFIEEALASVLEQKNDIKEIVIVDDGSTDRTPEILDRFNGPKIKRLRHDTGRGLPQALNAGLAACSGVFVARMDADDICLPGRFAAQADLLMRENADVCFGQAILFGNGPERLWRESSWPVTIWQSLFFNAFGPHPTVMFRRSAVAALDGYSQAFPHAEDYDLWDRCRDAGLKFCYLKWPVLKYRLHEAAVTSSNQVAMQDSTTAISARALSATFKDISRQEAEGLRFLACGLGDAKPDDLRLALEQCLSRLMQFTNRHGGRSAIAENVSASLFKRYPRIDDANRQAATRLLLRLAFSPPSIRRFFRYFRSLTLRQNQC